MTEYRSVSGSVAEDLFIELYDDLLKQNSMIYLGWDVYRWAVRQMQQQRSEERRVGKECL